MDLKCTFMLFSRVLFEDPDFAQIFSEKNIEVLLSVLVPKNVVRSGYVLYYLELFTF